jgi:hypothetical protein
MTRPTTCASTGLYLTIWAGHEGYWVVPARGLLRAVPRLPLKPVGPSTTQPDLGGLSRHGGRPVCPLVHNTVHTAHYHPACPPPHLLAPYKLHSAPPPLSNPNPLPHSRVAPPSSCHTHTLLPPPLPPHCTITVCSSPPPPHDPDLPYTTPHLDLPTSATPHRTQISPPPHTAPKSHLLHRAAPGSHLLRRATPIYFLSFATVYTINVSHSFV